MLFDVYTSEDARRFDPVLRDRFPRVAQQIFEQAQPVLRPGAALDNVEFDIECQTPEGRGHTRECDIWLVVVRRRSGGPSGNDVFTKELSSCSDEIKAAVRLVHNLAHAGGRA